MWQNFHEGSPIARLPSSFHLKKDWETLAEKSFCVLSGIYILIS